MVGSVGRSGYLVDCWGLLDYRDYQYLTHESHESPQKEQRVKAVTPHQENISAAHHQLNSLNQFTVTIIFNHLSDLPI